MDYDQVFPKLWLGSCPVSEEEIGRLVQGTCISAILNVLTDEDLERLGGDWLRIYALCRRLDVEVCRLPVKDGDSDDLRMKLPDCVKLLDGLLAAEHTVYLHCAAGIERSPSIAIAYLHWCMGNELEEAADYVTRCRGCSPDLDAIALATRDLLRGDAVRDRIERKAMETSGGIADRASWKVATKHVLRELIMEREPSL